MAYAPRNVEIVRPLAGDGQIQTCASYFKVLANRSSGKAICPGMFLVQESAGSNATWDGYKTADGTTASRLIGGFVVKCFDAYGNPKDTNYIGAAEAGLCLCYPVSDVLFRAVEDGTGGIISDANSVLGSVALAEGTITHYTQEVTQFPEPESNAVIDSSSFNSTVTVNAFQLKGLDPDDRNTSTTARVLQFVVGSTYQAGVL